MENWLKSYWVKVTPVQESKGGSSKARTESWLSHFQNLLGKKANLPENLSLPMEEISSELDEL